jgi:hypothetical protein
LFYFLRLNQNKLAILVKKGLFRHLLQSAFPDRSHNLPEETLDSPYHAILSCVKFPLRAEVRALFYISGLYFRLNLSGLRRNRVPDGATHKFSEDPHFLQSGLLLPMRMGKCISIGSIDDQAAPLLR